MFELLMLGAAMLDDETLIEKLEEGIMKYKVAQEEESKTEAINELVSICTMAPMYLTMRDIDNKGERIKKALEMSKENQNASSVFTRMSDSIDN